MVMEETKYTQNNNVYKLRTSMLKYATNNCSVLCWFLRWRRMCCNKKAKTETNLLFVGNHRLGRWLGCLIRIKRKIWRRIMHRFASKSVSEISMGNLLQQGIEILRRYLSVFTYKAETNSNSYWISKTPKIYI